MKIGIGGDAKTLEGIVGEAVAAESAGLATFSISNIFGHDAVSALTVVAAHTNAIELLTAVVPCFPRHPAALAQQALTAQTAAGGRFTLGIGTSHEVVIAGAYKLEFGGVTKRMDEYLQLLVPLLAQEPVDSSGEFFGATLRVRAPDALGTSCVLAALGPRMLRLAGARTDGTVLWLAGPKAIREAILPPLREASTGSGRRDPRIICGLPIALTNSPQEARENVNKKWGRYSSLPSYQRVLRAEGAATPGDVALVGDEAALEKGLRVLEESGASTFLGTLFEFESGCSERTLRFLESRENARSPGTTVPS